MNRQIALARDAGRHVLYTQDWHPKQSPHFQSQGGIWPMLCIGDSWGAEFHPSLTLSGEVVRKGAGTADGYSGFTVRDHETGGESGGESATPLEGLLRERGVERVVIVGLATAYYVKATALDAPGKGFETSVLLGAVAGVELEPGDTERAQDELRAAGVTLL